MNTIQTIIIGIVEGPTEFLPISSTHNMKFRKPMLGVDTPAGLQKCLGVVIQTPQFYRWLFYTGKNFRL